MARTPKSRPLALSVHDARTLEKARDLNRQLARLETTLQSEALAEINLGYVSDLIHIAADLMQEAIDGYEEEAREEALQRQVSKEAAHPPRTVRTARTVTIIGGARAHGRMRGAAERLLAEQEQIARRNVRDQRLNVRDERLAPRHP